MRHLFVLALLALFSVHAAADTTITYQGQLQENGQPFGGQADMTFELFDDFDPNDPNVGNSVAGPISVNDVDVSDGLFQVDLDFGAVYEQPVWIEITVGTDTLHPRQRLTSTPVAVHALNVSSTAGAWMLGGNAGTDPGSDFLGTTDTSPLELRVNNEQSLLINPVSYNDPSGIDFSGTNIIAGYMENRAESDTVGATISGGGGNLDGTTYSNTITALGHFSTIGGGLDNTASGRFSTIGGGTSNHADDNWITIGGGTNNIASERHTTIGGGSHNSAEAATATVAGGESNTASGYASSVPGGSHNVAAGRNSLAAGEQAKALHDGSFVWADHIDSGFESTNENQFLIRANGGVGINKNSPTQSLDVNGNLEINGWIGTAETNTLELRVSDQAVTRIFDGRNPGGDHHPNLIAGSELNVLDESNDSVYGATIGGGGGSPDFSTCGPDGSSLCINTVSANFATVVGGQNNYATRFAATAMGNGVTASGYNSTAMGLGTTASGGQSTAMGFGTTASGNTSMAAGRRAKAEHNGTFLWADNTNEDFTSTGPDQFLIRTGGGMGINENAPETALHVTGTSPDVDAQAQIHVEGEETSGAEGTGAAIAFLGHDGDIRRRWGRIVNVKENGTVSDTRSRMSFHVRGASGLPQERVRIESDGTTVNSTGTWATFSDRRLKRDIEPIEQPLDRLMSLEGIMFEYIENPEEPLVTPGGPRMGFVAQEVEEAFPEWVRESASGYKQVSLAGFEALAVEAIRKLTSQHEQLQSEITARDATIQELESRLAAADSERHDLREDLSRYKSLAERNSELEQRLSALEALLVEGEPFVGQQR